MLTLQATLNRGRFALNVDLTLPETGVTALLGPSGSGKSTLAALVAGLLTPETGLIQLGETVFTRVGGDVTHPINLAPQARGLGFLFQNHRLFPHLSVRDNVFFGPKRAGRRPPVDPQRLIHTLGIEHLLDVSPQELSGGESQRVALGRALLAAEKALILDEPLSSLDEERRDELLTYFEKTLALTTLPVLYITHRHDEAERLGNAIVRLRAGQVVSVTQKGADL